MGPRAPQDLPSPSPIMAPAEIQCKMTISFFVIISVLLLFFEKNKR